MSTVSSLSNTTTNSGKSQGWSRRLLADPSAATASLAQAKHAVDAEVADGRLSAELADEITAFIAELKQQPAAETVAEPSPCQMVAMLLNDTLLDQLTRKLPRSLSPTSFSS